MLDFILTLSYVMIALAVGFLAGYFNHFMKARVTIRRMRVELEKAKSFYSEVKQMMNEVKLSVRNTNQQQHHHHNKKKKWRKQKINPQHSH